MSVLFQLETLSFFRMKNFKMNNYYNKISTLKPQSINSVDLCTFAALAIL